MDITDQHKAKIAAGAWLEDVGRFEATGGKGYDVCIEMAAIKMVESHLPAISRQHVVMHPAIQENRGSGKAVSHCGGPVAVLKAAIRCRHYALKSQST